LVKFERVKLKILFKIKDIEIKNQTGLFFTESGRKGRALFCPDP